jgi:tripartite motif-containing protein 71
MQGGKPAGALPGKLSYPRGIAIDGQGSLYVADSRNHRIEKLKTADLSVEADFGSYTSLAGSDAKKLVTEAPGKMNEPNGLSVGPDGNLFVIDTWNSRIQVFSPKGKHKRTFTTEDGFFGPREIVVDAQGAAYVADTGKHRIVKFDAEGKKVRAWGTKGDEEGQFNEPIGLGLDGNGNLYVADRLNFRVQVFDRDGKFLREWEVDGWSKEQIDMEPHLAVDTARGLVYVTDGRAKKVLCYDLKGKKKATIEKDAAGVPFGVPIGVAVDKDGGLYVVDAAQARVVKLQGVQP